MQILPRLLHEFWKSIIQNMFNIELYFYIYSILKDLLSPLYLFSSIVMILMINQTQIMIS